MKKLFSTILISGLLFVHADDDYTLGQGFKSDKLPINIGGYLTGFYSNRANQQSTVSLDDVAIIGYGDIAPHFSAVVEFESAGFYEKIFQNGTKSEINRGTLRAERAYLNYSSSDILGLRVGKFITPAGIWNQTPVPVFKETFSKPRLAMEMFPKMSTGAMLYGSAPIGEVDIEYNLFTQIGSDLDPAYNNIESRDGAGGSLGVAIDGWSGGAAFGKYKNVVLLNDTQYFGIYQSYSSGRLKVTAEAFVTYDKYDIAGQKDRLYKKQSYYIQGVYKILPQLSGVLRNEYFENGFNNDKNVINTIGLNYKPHSAVSFKLEKQFNSQKASDVVIASFSVLF